MGTTLPFPAPRKLAFRSHSLRHRIHLLRAHDASGHPTYYFLDVPPLRVAPLAQATRHDAAFDLTEFGTVLASGYGHDIPESLLERMRETYGWAA